jgi:hypothetical protein
MRRSFELAAFGCRAQQCDENGQDHEDPGTGHTQAWAGETHLGTTTTYRGVATGVKRTAVVNLGGRMPRLRGFASSRTLVPNANESVCLLFAAHLWSIMVT